MQAIDSIKHFIEKTETLLDSKTHPHTIRLFRAVISLWIIVNTLILLPAADQFYSLVSHIPLEDTSGFGFWRWQHILSYPKYNFLYPFFIVLQLIFAVTAGISFWPRFSSAALFFFTINLDNRSYNILDGGNNLIHLLLVYLIFATPKISNRKTAIDQIDNLASNFSFYMCRIQVVLVYATAGLLKVAGPLWTKGVALFYTLSVTEYGSPILAKIMAQFPLFVVAATYSTLLFQISFPYMIWNRRTRPLYMAFGTFLHLQISLVMGLFMFGLAMCSSYFCFYTDEQAQSVIEKLKSVRYCIWKSQSQEKKHASA